MIRSSPHRRTRAQKTPDRPPSRRRGTQNSESPSALRRPSKPPMIQDSRTLTGDVIAGDGSPVAGAVVRCTAVEESAAGPGSSVSSGARSTTTNGQGRFAFEGLRRGEYRIAASADGFEIAPLSTSEDQVLLRAKWTNKVTVLVRHADGSIPKRAEVNIEYGRQHLLMKWTPESPRLSLRPGRANVSASISSPFGRADQWQSASQRISIGKDAVDAAVELILEEQVLVFGDVDRSAFDGIGSVVIVDVIPDRLTPFPGDRATSALFPGPSSRAPPAKELRHRRAWPRRLPRRLRHPERRSLQRLEED